jgi:hypothetical protein
MSNQTLPTLPSALIRVAIADLEKAEQDTNTYSINMGDWHRPNASKTGDAHLTCSVCLAGSVMAFSLEASDRHSYAPQDYDDATECALEAINALREGFIAVAQDYLDPDMDMPGWEAVDDRIVTHYEEDPAKFKAEMLQMASDLEAVNL